MPKTVGLSACYDARTANLPQAEALARARALQPATRMKYIPHPEPRPVPLIAGSLQGLGDVTPGAALVAMRRQLGVDGRPRIPVAQTRLPAPRQQAVVDPGLNPWASRVDPKVFSTFRGLDGFGDAASDTAFPAFSSGMTKDALMAVTLTQLKAFVSVTTRLVGAIPGFGDGPWEAIKMLVANGVAQSTKDAALGQLRALEARIKELEGRSAKVRDGSLSLSAWVDQAVSLANDAAYHLKSTFDSTLVGQIPAIVKDNINNLGANLKIGFSEMGGAAVDVVWTAGGAVIDKLKDKAKENPFNAVVIGGVVLGALALFAVVKTAQAAGAVNQAAGTIRSLTRDGYNQVKGDVQAAYGAGKKRLGLSGLSCGPGGCTCGGACSKGGKPGFAMLNSLGECGCNTIEMIGGLNGLSHSRRKRRKSSSRHHH